MKTYNISVTSGIEYGGVTANPVKAENGGTKYEFVFTPKTGYFVKDLRVSGVQIPVEDNKASCVIGGDCNLDITYARKTNEELEKVSKNLPPVCLSRRLPQLQASTISPMFILLRLTATVLQQANISAL